MLLSILFTIFLSLTRLTFALSAMSIPIAFGDPGFTYAIFSNIESVNNVQEIVNELDKYSIDGVSADFRFGSTTEIFNFNFTLNENGLPDFENGYSKNIDINQTNFALAYEYVLVPKETGEYIFTIDQVNQAAAIYIFNNRDMYCCGDMDLIGWLNRTSRFYYIPDDPMHQANSMTVHLEEGVD
ncbi:hypothetical protein C6P45_002831 [Maudiozyma exigua]|uniref:PA14 domain-containing protein n=1 Tax=Maudiozyma exigua TaxID=34358 RepID=A0A9P7B336_MAUEX|nr:hypothetical protein C6P45_002831 [Kazachstania exigua]